MSSKKSPRRSSGHRSTMSLQKTEVTVNVYDLLPPGKLSSILWTCGASLLHSGIVINNREYAFGGHDKRNQTGVYWTKPRVEPPGGTFRLSFLQGFTFSPQTEIDQIIRDASEEFQGTGYNLLNRNCNHFTSYLCEKLTGRKGPAWLNRAANIGVALPCVVPKEWIAPPEYNDVDGELVNEEGVDSTERSRMLTSQNQQKGRHSFDDVVCPDDLTDDDEWDSEAERRIGGSGKGKGVIKDTSGRVVPAAERAPLPRPT